MTAHIQRVALLTLAVVLAASQPLPGQVIGGFDTSRNGQFSVQFGTDASDFRTHVTTTFPSVSFTSTATLTPAFLSTVDVLVITAGFDGFTGMTPLSMAEQSALTGFVNNGGRALLFTDNNIQFEAAGDSMVNPFGLDATGAVFGSDTGTVTNTTHPVTNGPFGAPTTINYASFPGWYGSLGSNAAPLARLNSNNQVSLAVTDYDVLAPGSGAVLYWSDIAISNGAYSGTTVTLIDNALAYTLTPIPEPGGLLGALTVCGILSRRYGIRL